ncbi:cellulose biosynthesis cyclic di-GMP-binding regulatory protein BcsB [Pseudomonas defluvii]|nr:cellulose biosynthesis cyclic di-GMP-binding regulatory protein BcsB [Pseudomonas defluvii]
MSRTLRTFCFTSFLLPALGFCLAQAEPLTPQASTPNEVRSSLNGLPSWSKTLSFEKLGRSSDSLLLGIHNSDQIVFSMRHDRIASDVRLQLEYTPSPALLPQVSHLRVYLNDVLMSVVPIAKDQLGNKTTQELILDPRLVSDFNRVRLEFVGHYSELCEDPANSALWLNVSRTSHLLIQEQALSLKNDLAYFPMPFFDTRGQEKAMVNMVFADSPTLGEQRAAGILASYFGSLAGWRGTQFPVLFDQLPAVSEHNRAMPSIVFASNGHRPKMLADLQKFPLVQAPSIQIIDNPADAYSKVLLVLGRNEDDLVTAAQTLALGGGLLSGSQMTLDTVRDIPRRQPYDAPNWMRTDRPVRFAELIKYPEQLQASGLRPQPISLEMKLPPDLFFWLNRGVPLETRYRYTVPSTNDASQLNISLNNQFISSLPLGKNTGDVIKGLSAMVLSSDSIDASHKLLVPSLKIADRNTLRFDFNFASTLSSAQQGHCQTFLPSTNQVLIDQESTIDLSGYHHYLVMPDLGAFARSGFPFSRMADLSETMVMVPARSDATQISTLLETLAWISAQSGLPAFGLRLSDDWKAVASIDADLLVMGQMPQNLRKSQDLTQLLDHTRSSILNASRQQVGGAGIAYAGESAGEGIAAASIANAPLAAVIGLQSPFNAQRSIVAFLANSDEDHQLLRDVLNDTGKLDAMTGSVVLVRSSGVSGQQVGDQYFVGHLPWWMLVWYRLSDQPAVLAAVTSMSMLLGAFLLWRVLQWVARRRLANRP